MREFPDPGRGQPDPLTILARWSSAAATPALLALMVWLGLEVWEDVKSTRSAVLTALSRVDVSEKRNDYQDLRIDRVERLIERRSDAKPSSPKIE